MEIKLIGLGYLEGAGVVTATLSATDKTGKDHPIQAQWPVDELPEFDSVRRKAIEQVGGDLAFKILEAEEAEPVVKATSEVVDIRKDKELEAVVQERRQQLIDEREERRRQAEEEARLAEEAMNKEDANK